MLPNAFVIPDLYRDPLCGSGNGRLERGTVDAGTSPA
jgi:hypothetical protein